MYSLAYWLEQLERAILVLEDLGVLMGNSFSSAIHCKKVASKARQMLFMIKRSFAELSVSAFAAPYNTAPPWVLYAGLHEKTCYRRQLSGANSVVGDEARKGFPPTAI